MNTYEVNTARLVLEGKVIEPVPTLGSENTACVTPGQEVTAAEQPDARRPVLHGDFYAFAKKTCPTCVGLGYFFMANKLYREVKDSDGNVGRVQRPGLSTTSEPKVCGCAIKRFMRKHGANVDKRKDGALVWSNPIQKESLHG
jgi:hypothetical protein